MRTFREVCPGRFVAQASCLWGQRASRPLRHRLLGDIEVFFAVKAVSDLFNDLGPDALFAGCDAEVDCQQLTRGTSLQAQIALLLSRSTNNQ
jgi:hypothetical protein